MSEKDDGARRVVFNIDDLNASLFAAEINESGDFAKLREVDPRLHHGIAISLMGCGRVAEVMENLSQFQRINLSLIKYHLIREGQFDILARHILKFSDCLTKGDVSRLVREGYAERLIEAGYAEAVLKGLEDGETIDYQLVIDKLIDRGQGSLVMEYVEKFRGIETQMVHLLKQIRYKVASAKQAGGDR